MMCTQPRLEKLYIRTVRLSHGTEAALGQEQRHLEFAEKQFRLQKVVVIFSRFDSESYKQLVEIITRSPDLKEITVSGNRQVDGYNLGQLFPPLVSGPSWDKNDFPHSWQHLTAIELHHCHHLHDKWISTLLRSISSCGLRKVNLGDSEFGQESLTMLLKHHARTLTELSLKNCKQLTGPMVNAILCNCERLVAISASILIASDLAIPCSSSLPCRQESDRCIVCQPWVCKDLQHWSIGISLGSMDDKTEETIRLSRLMFARLASLKKLKTLHVKIVDRPHLHQLAFRQDRGLEQLKALQLLEDVQFYQEGSSSEDLKWMSKTFSRLMPALALRLRHFGDGSVQERSL